MLPYVFFLRHGVREIRWVGTFERRKDIFDLGSWKLVNLDTIMCQSHYDIVPESYVVTGGRLISISV